MFVRFRPRALFPPQPQLCITTHASRIRARGFSKQTAAFDIERFIFLAQNTGAPWAATRTAFRAAMVTSSELDSVTPSQTRLLSTFDFATTALRSELFICLAGCRVAPRAQQQLEPAAAGLRRPRGANHVCVPQACIRPADPCEPLISKHRIFNSRMYAHTGSTRCSKKIAIPNGVRVRAVSWNQDQACATPSSRHARGLDV